MAVDCGLADSESMITLNRRRTAGRTL